MATKRKRGRPRKPPGEVKRCNFSTRITQRVMNLLIEAARENGRSVSSEISMRVEASFRDDEIARRLDSIEMAIRNGHYDG